MLDGIGERLARWATVRVDRFGVVLGFWLHPLFSVCAGIDFKLKVFEVRVVLGDAAIVT